jgi:adenylate cyclase
VKPIDPARFREVPTLNGPEASRLGGVDHAFAKRVWLTLGLPDIPDDEIEFDESDVEVLRGLKLIRDQGYPDEDILEVARAYGQAMSRVAQAEVRLFNKVFIAPMREQVTDEDELAERLEAVVPALLELLGKLIHHVHRHHLAIALQDLTAFDHAATETRAAGFVDLVDFSRVTQELEGEDLGHLVSRFESMAMETCVANGGHVVKMIGDAIMFVAPDPATGLRVALAVVAGVEEDDGLPAARAGLDYGGVVPMSGDFFGRPVNVAARLTSFARPGTVVVSEALKEAADAPLQLSHIGKIRLHNVGTVRAFKVNGLG